MQIEKIVPETQLPVAEYDVEDAKKAFVLAAQELYMEKQAEELVDLEKKRLQDKENAPRLKYAMDVLLGIACEPTGSAIQIDEYKFTLHNCWEQPAITVHHHLLPYGIGSVRQIQQAQGRTALAQFGSLVSQVEEAKQKMQKADEKARLIAQSYQALEPMDKIGEQLREIIREVAQEEIHDYMQNH